MKKYIFIFTAFNLCILVLLTSLVFLEETYPFHPGERLYGVQHSAEQVRLHLTASPGGQAEFALKLAERRLANLAVAVDSKYVVAVARALEHALVEAVEHLELIPDDDQQKLLYQRFDIFLTQADLVIAGIESLDGIEAVASLSDRVDILQDFSINDDRTAPAPNNQPPTRIAGERVSFLGVDIDHKLLSLTDGHANLGCESCHAEGIYKDTPSECQQCHPPSPSGYIEVVPGNGYPFSMPLYPEHFAGECQDCHGIVDWAPTQFDHAGIVECNSCHWHDLPEVIAAPDLPFIASVAYQPEVTFANEEHFPGDCILCHSDTSAWEIAAFDHKGVNECESCHLSETPGGHYQGVCTNCHSDAEDWRAVAVDHSAYPDCLTCHMADNPKSHYSGLCSSCHNTEIWAAAIFNHSGYTDCRSCHAKPAQHFRGQCSSCHREANWEVKNYSHEGLTPECTKCHSRPSGHYSDDCSTCHTTRNWRTVKLDHSGSTDCQNCHSTESDHYSGSCSNCHSTGQWASANFNHSGYNDCLACHNPPSGHYTGLCSKCHNTQNWSDVKFDHSGLIDCWSCHIAEQDHYPGQCSNCHTTSRWSQIDFDHTGLTDCSGCHTIENHWPGECSNCHNTSNWADVKFDHTGYTNCKSCHTRPANHSARGQCSNCHTTDTWEVPTETPGVAIRPAFSRIITIPGVTLEPPSSRDSNPDCAEAAPTPPSSR